LRRFTSALLTLLLLGIISFGCAANAAPGLRDSVFLIEMENGSRCTAFAIGKKRFVTAYHCPDSDEDALTLYDSQGLGWAAVLHTNIPSADVAVYTSEMPATPLRLTTRLPEVGEIIYSDPDAMPKDWQEMTPAEAGRNAAKLMLYYAILRSRTPRENQRAIALYNTYGFGYALGMSFRNAEGRREMLWFKDLDEILSAGRTREGCVLC